MAVVLAGAFALVFLLWLGYAFTRANPATLARSLRYLGVGVLALAAIGLALTERIGLAVFMGTMAWTLFSQGRLWPGGWPHYGFSSGGGTRPKRNQSSAVRTDWIALELDHATGQMDGEVLKGAHAGAWLSALAREALVSLYGEASGDAQTARLLETYLDRRFGRTWRDAATNQSQSDLRGRADRAICRAMKPTACLGLSREPMAKPSARRVES